VIPPFIVFSFLALQLCVPPHGQGADSTAARRVRPGVFYRSIVRSAGPWRIHALEIDLRRRDLAIRSAHAFDRVRGRETTSAIVGRFPDSLGTVVAAMNADFFQLESGETVNNQITEGRPVRAVGERRPLPRSQFGMTWDGRPFIERVRLEGSILIRGFPPTWLGGVNVLPESGGVSLLTPAWGSTPPDSFAHRRLQAVPLRLSETGGDTLLLLRANAPANDTLNGGYWLLSRTGDPFPQLSALRIGDTVRIVESVSANIRSVRTLVGGTPRIVQDGVNVAGIPAYMEGAPPEFSSRRHPRSGVGFSRDSTRVVFLVVDGRQQGSVGMTLPEFADLMIEMGVWEGLNLDGGGSTAMVVGGTVVNVPSDPAGERAIANCLLLIAHP
jgi:hypothetical protein